MTDDPDPERVRSAAVTLDKMQEFVDDADRAQVLGGAIDICHEVQQEVTANE